MRAFAPALVAAVAMASITPVLAQGQGGAPGATASNEHRFVRPDQLNWQPAPPSLPPGSQIAVLRGDPTARSGDFVMRFRATAGYHIPPHSHPTNENLTVISGSLLYGMSGPADRSKATSLPAGTYIFLPANTAHTVWAGDQGVELEIHAPSPFDVTYVNPADDPRKQKASTGE